MGNPRRTAIRVACVVVAVAIFVVASVPLPATAPAPETLPLDKVYHALAFALLGALAVASLSPPEGTVLGRRVLAGFGLAAAYGFGTEFYQAFVPGRSVDPLDAAANVLGAAIGAAGAWWWIRRSTFAVPSRPA